VRVEDDDVIQSLRAVVKQKYDPPPSFAEGESWFFRLD
jgi:hypothetical protein